ncbi:hypothetical protein DXG01_004405 [Tephrocybe rancida]|nr:hypothetical protein DXG01_004405 [Tephrocybe rancida]
MSSAWLGKYYISQTLLDKKDIEMPDLPYSGDAHGKIYYAKMKNVDVRITKWYSYNFDQELRDEFNPCLSKRLADWQRASAHKNIAPFYGILKGHERSGLPSLVTARFKHNITHLPMGKRLLPLREVADAISYMHGLNPPVVHRGIRGKNIAIDANGQPLLNDLCLEFLPQAQGISETGIEGESFDALRWVAPEVVDPPEELQSELDITTLATDVYGFGMTLLEVMSGKKPWADRNNRGVISDLFNRETLRRPKAGAITDELWALIQECIAKEPLDRPKMNEVRDRLQSLIPVMAHL